MTQALDRARRGAVAQRLSVMWALVLLSGCVTTTAPRDAVPTVVPPPEVGTGTAITSVLAEGLVQEGVIAQPSDLADVPLTFRVLGPDDAWVPHADVIVDFGDLGRMLIGSADENGEITLRFSASLLELDPVVVGMADGQFLDVYFRFVAPVAPGAER